MSVIDRRGACPTLTSPMETGDGLLVRLNPILQGLTPKQLIGLCQSADRNGNGIVEITARGSFQIRGLAAAGVEALARDVNALAISVRTGMPVETGPLAGYDPEEIADPRSLAEGIREAIAQAGIAARLGPKVSVVVDGGGAIRLDAVMADVRLVAVNAPGVSDAEARWNLSIGGDVKTARVVGVVDKEAALSAVVSILAAIGAKGVDARAKDLDAVSPTRLPGSQESKLPGVKRRASVGIFRLKDNRAALGIALPFGHTESTRLIAYASAAESLGIDDLRLSPGRALLALCHSDATANTLREQAKSLGFITDPSDPRLAISACTGAPACASGHIPAREIAAAIVNDALELIDPNTTLHVSGCAKGCAHPATAALTLVGDKNGIGLVVNGTARHTPLAYTRLEALTPSLRRLTGLVKDEQRQDETTANTLFRLNAERLATVFRQGGK